MFSSDFFCMGSYQQQGLPRSQELKKIPNSPSIQGSLISDKTQTFFSHYINQLYIPVMDRLQLVLEAISKPTEIYDYIVVGAGISGLQAVDILTSQTNNKVLVVEANQQLGGRIGSISIGGLEQAKKNEWVRKNIENINTAIVEKGATWIEERHTVLRELCRQFGITLREQHYSGQSIYLAGDTPYTPLELLKHPDFAEPLKNIIEIIDNISFQYNKVVYSDLNVPSFQAKKMLKKYDGITLEDFLKDKILDKYADARSLLDCFFEHTECISSAENSMHQVLTKNARSNDLGILKEFLGDFGHEASYLVNGGTDLLIKNFVQKIEKQIGRPFSEILRLSHQVITIDNRPNDFITVICEADNRVMKRFRCKKVICAAPLAVSRTIAFTNISTAKKLILDNQLRTNAVKSFMVVKTPFWRKDSNGKPLASGDCLFSQKHHVNMCHDISPLDQSCGIIVFFHNGRRLDAWQSKFIEDDYKNKRQYFIVLMSKLFKVNPKDRAKLFQGCFYYECSYMNDQFIRSGFQSNTRPGTFGQVIDIGDSLNALYRDENGITFVGSEYSLQFASYMEGAVRITRQKVFKLIGKPDPLAHLQVENVVSN